MSISESGVDQPNNEGSRSRLREVLARIRSGDESAARELLTRYEAQVRMVVRRQLPRLLRSRFDSLDFLQSVWGSFFHQIQTRSEHFEDSRHLVLFLARTARNKVIDEHRRATTQKHDVRREESLWTDQDRPREVIGHDDSPSELAVAHESYDRLRALLPEGRRAILELKAAGLDSAEIGRRLGLSDRTVRRVLAALARRVAETGGQAEEGA